MSLLNTILGAAGSMMGGGQQQSNPMLSIVMGLLANQGGGGQAAGQGAGGLAGLMGQFQQAGMGNMLESWVGKGSNLPISGEQLAQVLGSGQMGQIASQLGLSQGDASGQLASMLPQLIDQLTPNGAAPEDGFGNADQLMGLLGGLLKK